MFKTIVNAWKTVDLRKKILFTVLIVLLYRVGTAIPVPFLNAQVLSSSLLSSQGSLFQYLNILSGGAMSQAGMAFYVRMQSGSEDLVVMPEEEFDEFAESGYFMDLTSVVPEEWTDRLVVVEQRYDDYEDEQPEPMACAIRLCDIGGFPDTEYTQHAVIAISYNPAHADTAADFLNDLLRNVEK